VKEVMREASFLYAELVQVRCLLACSRLALTVEVPAS
jgi:hypothetical protein